METSGLQYNIYKTFTSSAVSISCRNSTKLNTETTIEHNSILRHELYIVYMQLYTIYKLYLIYANWQTFLAVGIIQNIIKR